MFLDKFGSLNVIWRYDPNLQNRATTHSQIALPQWDTMVFPLEPFLKVGEQTHKNGRFYVKLNVWNAFKFNFPNLLLLDAA